MSTHLIKTFPTRVWVYLGIVLLAYSQLLLVHFRHMWRSPEYQFFPFVFLAVAALAYSRAEPVKGNVKSQLNWKLIGSLAVVAVLLLFLGVAISSSWLAIVSALVLSVIAFLQLGQLFQIQNLWGIWALLWLLVPLPGSAMTQLIQQLQRTSSRVSSELLDLIGINHAMQGNTLMLPGKQLFVDEACSGIVSVMSVVACAAIYAVWKNRSLLHVVLLVGAGVLWAMLMNVARISSIAFADDRWAWDLSTGTPHEILGLVVFLTTFTAVASTDQLLEWLFAPIRLNPVWQRGIMRNPLLHGWNSFTGWMQPTKNDSKQTIDRQMPVSASTAVPQSVVPRTVVACFVVFALLGVYQFAGAAWSNVVVESLTTHGDSMNSETIPEKLGVWHKTEHKFEQRPGYGNGLGASSQLYFFSNDNGAQAQFSFDYPFLQGWHELTVCYSNVGWVERQRTVIEDTEAGDSRWNYVSAEFERPGRFGFLVYGLIDSTGQPVNPPADSMLDRWKERIQNRGMHSSTRYFQVQTWCESDGPLDDETKQQLNEAFLEFRKYIRVFLNQSETTPK